MFSRVSETEKSEKLRAVPVNLHHLRNVERTRNSLVEVPIDHDENQGARIHPRANPDVLIGSYRQPAIDIALLETAPNVCVICGVVFNTRGGLHAHLTRHRHIYGQLDGSSRLPKYECRSCRESINAKTMLKHECFIRKQVEIRQKTKLLDTNGGPLMCILCRGRILPSRVQLVIHLIVAHSVHRDPYKCVFCQAEFKSENLMMQEMHAFECHAPEIFIITRKACYAMICNGDGTVMDPTVPFVCFYDLKNLEKASLNAIFTRKTGVNSTKSVANTVPETGGKVCTEVFNTLDEYSTHVLCFHGAKCFPDSSSTVPHANATGEESVLEVIRRQMKSKYVPGPTVREILKSQATASVSVDFSTNTQVQSMHPLDDKTAEDITQAVPRRMEHARINCRICLAPFSSLDKLNDHARSVHLPANKKRLRHLGQKKQLANLLDMTTLCTECYSMFDDVFSLQVHMMVSHAGKDWLHCGICNYEYFSESGSTPDHLKLVRFNEPDRAPSTSDSIGHESWPFSADLMWRTMVTHERRHREELYPSPAVPYLPTRLIDHLLHSGAIQAMMTSDWLMKRDKVVIEGDQERNIPISGVGGPMATKEAFASGMGVLTEARIMDENLIDTAMRIMEDLLRATKVDQTAEVSSPGKTEGQMPVLSRRTLPRWMAETFGEIGERNATKQDQRDFSDNF